MLSSLSVILINSCNVVERSSTHLFSRSLNPAYETSAPGWSFRLGSFRPCTSGIQCTFQFPSAKWQISVVVWSWQMLGMSNSRASWTNFRCIVGREPSSPLKSFSAKSFLTSDWLRKSIWFAVMPHCAAKRVIEFEAAHFFLQSSRSKPSALGPIKSTVIDMKYRDLFPI